MTVRFSRVVVFDLDDTLYLERDYVRSGFAAAGQWAAQHHGITGLSAAAWSKFEQGRRGDIFDSALAALGVAGVPGLIPGLVRAYRRHRPAIALAPDAAAWLADIPPDTALALVTDGPASSQSNKIAALGLATRGFAPMVLTARIGRGFGKPHPRAFELVRDSFGLPAARYTYVADNPRKDFLAPRRMGWRTVQVARPERLHRGEAPDREHSPESVIETLDGLA